MINQLTVNDARMLYLAHCRQTYLIEKDSEVLHWPIRKFLRAQAELNDFITDRFNQIDKIEMLSTKAGKYRVCYDASLLTDDQKKTITDFCQAEIHNLHRSLALISIPCRPGSLSAEEAMLSAGFVPAYRAYRYFMQNELGYTIDDFIKANYGRTGKDRRGMLVETKAGEMFVSS